uniref:Uncharacterized protein n=1 Tax=Panagrolaimus sp. ES5 TaxID=591445 RepID=A0AC34FMS8_9BILA
MQKLVASLIFATFIAFIDADIQSTAIQGYINCDGTPASFAKIELWDKDTFDPDDLMTNGTAGKAGNFYIQGKESEVSTIDPELRIYHKCGDENVKCFKVTIIEIPDEFITKGANPKSIYDAGNVNLRILPNKESKICN